MLTHYGFNNIVVMALIATIMLAVGCYFGGRLYISIPLIVLAIALYFFTFWFFRDPARHLPSEAKDNPSVVISPADGVITEIVEEDEPNYLNTRVIRISIFLSPLDVHVNRIPATGVVEYYHYNEGKFGIASRPKASLLNEQSHIGLKTEYGKIFFKQIVGAVARRLVCELKVGDSVNIGDKFGMMKFGSRMDVALPLDANIVVKVGDKVRASETILAKLKVR